MDTLQQARSLVTGFIEEIWNGQHFQQASKYLHPDFRDHSLPSHFPAGIAGTLRWIEAVGKSFAHKTIIDEVVTEADKVVLRLRMQLKHVGKWRDLEPTGAEVTTQGYRLFRVEGGKIIEQWALIDGEGIEKSLKDQTQGCKLPG